MPEQSIRQLSLFPGSGVPAEQHINCGARRRGLAFQPTPPPALRLAVLSGSGAIAASTAFSALHMAVASQTGATPAALTGSPRRRGGSGVPAIYPWRLPFGAFRAARSTVWMLCG